MSISANTAARLEGIAASYVKDLECMDEAQIMESAGGSARKPVDFTFEAGLINLRIAARIRGQEPPAEPEGEEWWTAPDELRSKAAITEYIKSSCKAVADAITGMSDEEVTQEVKVGENMRPIYALATFAAMHTMYHDAQLNFIQSLNGDLKLHWG